MNDAITLVEPGCWVLRRPNGADPYLGDWTDPHYPTEAAAAEDAPRVASNYVPPPELVPARYPDACYAATAACGYQYDEDDEGVVHWTNRDDVYRSLLNAGWKPLEGGGMTCADRDTCDVCSALPLAAVPAVIPGQLALPLDAPQRDPS